MNYTMGEYLCFVAAGFYRFFATSPKVTTRKFAEFPRNKKTDNKAKAKKPKKKATRKNNIERILKKTNKCIGSTTRNRLYHHGQPLSRHSEHLATFGVATHGNEGLTVSHAPWWTLRHFDTVWHAQRCDTATKDAIVLHAHHWVPIVAP